MACPGQPRLPSVGACALGDCSLADPNMCLSRCGDGVLANNEGCDDGDVFDHDGCSAICTLEQGYDCEVFDCDTTTCAEVCGNGVRTPLEACDDGNRLSGDGCSHVCIVEVMELDVYQFEDILAISWRLPAYSNISYVRINRTDTFALLDTTEYFSVLVEECLYDDDFFECSYKASFPLPQGHSAPRYLISVQAVSEEEKHGNFGDSGELRTFLSTFAEEFIVVVGYPSSVDPISIIAQTESLWSIKWTQPEFFFANLDPKTNSYDLNLTCTGVNQTIQSIHIRYEDGELVRQPVVVANFHTLWNDPSAESGGVATVDVQADESISKAACLQGSIVSILVQASNLVFSGNSSDQLQFTAVAAPGPPFFTAIQETSSGFQLQWNQVEDRTSLHCCHL